jgi:hypothetical protein
MKNNPTTKIWQDSEGPFGDLKDYPERQTVMSNKRAFTLIEQLVMIAVFPLLMTLLLPALQRVRRVASMDEKFQRLLKAGL